jgi:hypothetical protein
MNTNRSALHNSQQEKESTYAVAKHGGDIS